jgi:dTDP-4-dehydrorhamnose 3,5-epimerase-like enzyme
MSDNEFDKRWSGLRPSARARLEQRDYSERPLAAGDFLRSENPEPVAIPGVEILPRTIYPQRGRGYFGEFARASEGRLHAIGLWPRQWATARMFAGTAKGFHIHPPAIPDGVEAADWFRSLYLDAPNDFARRPYAAEQWDAMFFVQGMAEMLLVDERDGLGRAAMRFYIDGDDVPGFNNAGVVIPAGVAHAIRSVNSTDLIMVYGTSTVFEPLAEGRIASGVEKHGLPPDWEEYLS